ncbi:fibroblast growth factor receptor-like 1 [Centruroides sculpturatus]|uniref:fibroblast growth factor receptor-like 1 n=1 Tax=Centruroides sculpturatus TaxID=218467 RepID=UPI000C6DAB0B|nr:fibroblast growth factor receptor-like 1 [Centruroides sculpturatus]
MFSQNSQIENDYPEVHHKKYHFGSKPRWLDLYKFDSTDKPAGSTAILKCKAAAKPEPSITWYKNGKILEHGPRIKIHGYKLLIESLRETDSGVYTCIVFNLHGSIQRNFTLDVIGIVNEEPVITGNHLVNTTVFFNETATFRCNVKSKVRPIIKWLKQVTSNDNKNGQPTFKVNNESYIVLKSSEHVKQENDSYLNKLIIRNANMKHAGKYVCWAANIQGYNFKSASLSVIEPPSQMEPKSERLTSDIVIVIIVVAIVVTVFNVVLFALYGISRCRTNRNSSYKR